jgi:D-glycero-alpha-D-manno-heptose-7-phosphate kinase
MQSYLTIKGDQLKHPFFDETIRASAPCRVDMGGTLDISTFNFPLRHLKPCTFNAAIRMRTEVSLHPYHNGYIKVSSKGFESAEFIIDTAPFDHPLGLVFAVAAYFRADGVHICIESSSPPKSALGGSSSAVVALVAACYAAFRDEHMSQMISRDRIVFLAHALEQSVAGVPCGIQDQLAAAYGGVNAWYWIPDIDGKVYRRKCISNGSEKSDFRKHILIAYCGVPHESKDVNSRWIKQFVSGMHRSHWKEIILCTQSFVDALMKENYKEASWWMNRETDIRCHLTPDVLDDMGKKLVKEAVGSECGARFTGAGGGGCIWALGERENIIDLKGKWENTLSERPTAFMIDEKIDADGLLCSHLLFNE